MSFDKASAEGACGLHNWNWQSLTSAVQQVIDRGGIGTPAALRLTIHHRCKDADARADVEQLLRDAMQAASAWFGAPSSSTYTIGGGGQPTLAALKWPSGQSALIGVSVSATGPIGGNAMLMGSRGTMYHELTGAKGGPD